MFGLDAPTHWIILAILAMTFFGYKKLPDMTRSFGRSIRIFRTEMTSMTDSPAGSNAGACSHVECTDADATTSGTSQSTQEASHVA